MQVNIDGQWTEVPDSTPQALPWEASLPYPERQGDNQGCPPGYFCEYISPGGFGSGYVRVCRRFDQQIASNPAIMAAETGPGLVEQTTINIASAAQAVVNAALPVGGVVLLAVGAFLFLSWRR